MYDPRFRPGGGEHILRAEHMDFLHLPQRRPPHRDHGGSVKDDFAIVQCSIDDAAIADIAPNRFDVTFLK